MPNPSLKEQWERFQRSSPGRRFQDRYESRSKVRKKPFNLLRILKILVGMALVPLGLVMVPAPGPGWLVVFLALALLSDEFPKIARALDRTEVRLRDLAGRAWGRLSRHDPRFR